MGSSLTAGYLVSILVILDESIWPLEALIPIFAKWNNKVTHSSVFLKMKKKKNWKKNNNISFNSLPIKSQDMSQKESDFYLLSLKKF